ncbi:MarR family transcriptional regulator [Stigmatella sp. ncwal1]|uniref:MarR family transcriptional regulator n=1 Tax=Stigmatella ashevillensis TaxID=2995309 RepID=A0ABT5DAR4_9BACT|nr:MarR family transcriptional regulator [Stigmatella ashevillena]MDC0710616.1 MarR family transcriptional regulator [Stigmatella ashevillena]
MAGEQKKSPPSEERLAREAWAPLFELIQEQMRHFPALAAEFELSPVQAHVLRMLGCGPQPMSALADYLSCDASNVTGLVDRLEGRGLMERRSAEHDRRVKMLCLTEAGRALRQRLQERMSEPPEVIVALSSQEKCSLRDILSQAMERLAAQKAQGRSGREDGAAEEAREG